MSNLRYYFAYGSNMVQTTLRSRVPSARFLGVALLRDHRLAFTRRSLRWNAGVADIVEYEGLSLYGALYEADVEQLSELDSKEGVPHAYNRKYIDVRVGGREFPAMTYCVTGYAEEWLAKTRSELSPSDDYFAEVLRGAAECGLPPDYIAFLKNIKKQFDAGTRNKGLFLTQTYDRNRSSGDPLIRLNTCDGRQVGARDGRLGVVLMADEQIMLGKLDVTDSVKKGKCEVDQALRVGAEIGGRHQYGYRVSVRPASGSRPRWSPIRPRALVLSAHTVSRSDSEKNYCVLHPDRIRALGLQEGEFAQLFVPTVTDSTGSAEVKRISLRVFSGSATEVTRQGAKFPYPDRWEVYFDFDARRRLGLRHDKLKSSPEEDWNEGLIRGEERVRRTRSWVGTPVLVRPAIGRAMANRALFYGVTALLGIDAFIQLLRAFMPKLSSPVSAGVALVAAALVTIAVSALELHARLRY